MAIRRAGPGFATIDAALKGLNGIEAKTGWFETAKYPNETPVATIAYIMENGAVTHVSRAAGVLQGSGGGGATYIPPRPFMGPTVAAKGDDWMTLLGQSATVALMGEAKPRDVMEKVALKAAGDVGKTITELKTPPLAPSTIRAKGFDKLLVETGLMLQSVTGIVEDGQ